MFILGIMALSQSMILPGALVLKTIDFKGSFVQKLCYGIGISLVLTYCGIIILTFLNLYNQAVVLILFGVQIFFILKLYRNELEKPVVTTVTQGWNRAAGLFTKMIHPFFDEQEANSLPKLFRSVFNLVFLALAMSILWWAFKLALNYLGTIFDAWDVVLSWNRWAVTWAMGQMPLDTRTYPQLIPANWSLTYVLMGNTSIQFFAKALMLPFTFLTFLLFIDLGFQTRRGGFWAGIVIIYLLLKKFLFPQLTNGYIDVAVVFFSSLTIYSMVKLMDVKDESQLPRLMMISAVFVGGSAMVKQAGLYVFILYIPLVFLGIVLPLYKGHIAPLYKPLFKSFAVAVVLALPWYAYKFIAFRLGLDRPEVTDLIELSSNIHDATSPISQMIAALSKFDIYLVLFLVILLGFAFLPPLYRWMTLLLVIPYPLIWSMLASYDTRNLSAFLPFFGIISGMALEEISLRVVGVIENLRFPRLRMFIIPFVLLGGLFLMSYILPASGLQAKQTELQSQVFSPQKNELIYELANKEGQGFKILTNYPVNYLPGLEDAQVYFTYQDFNIFINRIEDPSIEYLFVPRSIDTGISEYIQQKLDVGDFELVFENKEWLYYRMIHIAKR